MMMCTRLPKTAVSKAVAVVTSSGLSGLKYRKTDTYPAGCRHRQRGARTMQSRTMERSKRHTCLLRGHNEGPFLRLKQQAT